MRNLVINLADFFSIDLKIRKNLEVQLTFDMSKMSHPFWVKKLCQWISRVEVKGAPKLRVAEAGIWKIKEVTRIRNAVVENPVFGEFIVEKNTDMKYCVIKRKELVSDIDERLISYGWIS